MTSAPHEPWAFGERIERICREYLELRYRLLPYLYTLFWRAATHGEPILRPLVYDYFGDDRGHIFEDAINRLARAGITRGCNPPENTGFCPDEPIRRDQMATFLARAGDLSG